MDPTGFLIAGNAVVWLGVGGYLAFLALNQKRIGERLTQLERLTCDEDEDTRA
ncbi:MAG: CcmD family protein [Oceanidesulfovibrio sp.]